MGARLFRGWLLRPLVKSRRSEDDWIVWRSWPSTRSYARSSGSSSRQSSISSEFFPGSLWEQRDPEIIVGLANSFESSPSAVGLTEGARAPLICEFREQLDPLEDVRTDIETTLVSEPPATLKDGGVIRGARFF